MDEPTRTRTTQTIDHRTVEEERLVRAAYYANMAANLIERLDADSAGARDLLIKSGYDIVGELRHIVSWAKEERDRRFPLPMQNASQAVDQ